MLKFSKIALAAVLAVAAAPTFAATANDQFDVTITLVSECTIQADDHAFGTQGAIISAAIDQTSALTVNCNPGAAYDIGLSAGDGTGSSVASRFMDDGGVNTVAYQLYSDASRTSVWGETIGSDTVAGVGNGADQIVNVYGRVLAGQSKPAGNYLSTVTATVTF